MSEGSSIGPQLVASFGGKIYDIGVLKRFLSATLGAFALGNVVAWTSSALPGIKNDSEFGNLTTTEEGQIPAIFSLGAALVPWFAGVIDIPYLLVN